jgi:hypothetical protein
MSSQDLQRILLEERAELISAEKKAKFFRAQYDKHKPNSPELASDIEVLLLHADTEVERKKTEIVKTEDLKKRYEEMEAKRGEK